MARRYPTAAEVERMAEELTARPRGVRELCHATRMRYAHAKGALKSLGYQKRATFVRGQGWAARRRCG